MKTFVILDILRHYPTTIFVGILLAAILLMGNRTEPKILLGIAPGFLVFKGVSY
jgi:hypothetical protein